MKVKQAFTTGADGSKRLPDGQIVIERKEAAAMLQVTANTITAMVREGKLSDLTKGHGIKHLLLRDVEKLKALREGGADGGEGDSAAVQLENAQRARKIADVDKYHARLRRSCSEYTDAAQAAAAAQAVLDAVAALADWEAPFLDLLTADGRKELKTSLIEVATNTKRLLKSFLDAPTGDPEILHPARKPATAEWGTTTEVKTFLEQVKTHLTRLEVAEEAGEILPEHHARQDFGDAAVSIRTQLFNLRQRLVPFTHRNDRATVKQDVTAKIADLREDILAKLPEGVAHDAFAKGFEPPEELTASDWADKYRVLSSKTSAEPGPFRTDRTPYMREIADAIGNDETRRISVRLCAQAGKSELLLTAIGFAIDQTPGPMMLVQPSVEMAGDFMRSRVQPMIDTTPRLAEKIKELDDRQKGGATSKELAKEFQGGQLVAVGSNSPASLASRPIRILAMDEVDRFPATAGKEGSPRALAERRTQSFLHTRKILAVSTPTVKGESEIDKLYELGTQEEYHACCPHCGDHHVMQISNLHWNNDDPATAGYVAPCCGVVWDDADRTAATAAGRWEARNPAAGPEHRSFHANALVSPFHTHESMAKEILDARGDAMAERTLINTMYAESYTDETSLITEESVLGRIEGFDLNNIPEDVLAIVAGVDVQRDRLEALFVGFSETQSFILSRNIIQGAPDQPETWKAADELFDREFDHPFGGKIGVDMVIIDSGDSTTDVMQWVVKRNNRFGIKGVAGVDKPRWALSTSTKSIAAKMGGKLNLVGTFQAKESLLLSLQRETSEQGSIRIGVGVGESAEEKIDFANQLLGEYRRQSVQRDGRVKVEWVPKPGRRHEVMDCAVYAFSGFEGYLKQLVNWDDRRERMTVRPAPVEEYRQPEPAYQQPTPPAASTTGWTAF